VSHTAQAEIDKGNFEMSFSRYEYMMMNDDE
jgi:hypothetical protein